MADNESSHLMWIIIVVAIASLIFMGLKVAFPGLIDQTMDKMTRGVKGINVGGDSDNPGGESVDRPDENDAKWVSKSNYGVNGKLLIDKDGNGVIYSIDSSKPIEVNGSNETNEFFPTSELDTATDITFVSKVVAKGAIANSSVFGWGSTLESLSGLDLWDTSNVVSMNGMFSGLKKLTSLDGYQNWDTSNVTMMANLFLNDANLKSVDLSHWNTSKVTTMSGMFSSTTALDSVNFSNIDLRSLTTMDTMFMSSGVKSVTVANLKAAPSGVSKSYAFYGLSTDLTSQLESSLISQ